MRKNKGVKSAVDCLETMVNEPRNVASYLAVNLQLELISSLACGRCILAVQFMNGNSLGRLL
jgi:hypothetical protein